MTLFIMSLTYFTVKLTFFLSDRQRTLHPLRNPIDIFEKVTQTSKGLSFIKLFLIHNFALSQTIPSKLTFFPVFIILFLSRISQSLCKRCGLY